MECLNHVSMKFTLNKMFLDNKYENRCITQDGVLALSPIKFA